MSDGPIQVGIASKGHMRFIIVDRAMPRTVAVLGHENVVFNTLPENIPLEEINVALAPVVEKAMKYDEMMRTKKADLEPIMGPLFDKAALAGRE